MTSPSSRTVPAHLRMVDSHVPSIEGIKVVFNNTFRTGTLVLEVGNSKRPGQITCSPETLSWLDATENNGGREWGIVANALRNAIREVERDMVASKLVDLSARGHKVVDRRKPAPAVNDRIERLANGISMLVAQMSAVLSGDVVRTPEVVAEAAKHYAALAAEMKDVRQTLTNAEGMFDVAQIQVMQLMGGDDD